MSFITVVGLDHAGTDLDPSGAVAVHFTPRRPLRFVPGQFGLWVVPGGGVKPFTIASAPAEGVVTLGTQVGSGSRYKQALGALGEGSVARFIGPVGGFTVPRGAQEVVMLAQGIGVTPFRSMLRQDALSGAEVHTTLVHVGTVHPFEEDTAATATESHYPRSREEFTDRVTAVARAHPAGRFMVSGTPAFVRSTTATLTALSVPTSRIAKDSFYGISARPEPAVSAAGPASAAGDR